MDEVKEGVKMKRVIWSTEETEKMLHIIRENNIVSLLDGKRYRNAEIYQQVAEKLSQEGYNRSPDQIRVKLKHLKKDFIDTKKNNMISGANRTECDFYEILDEIYGTRPVIVTDDDGIESASPIVEIEHTTTGDSYDDFSSPNSQGRALHPPKAKRFRRSAEEFQHVEENLLDKSHEFWAKEFENQRKHERELHESFCTNLHSIYQEFTSTITCEKNRPSTSTVHCPYISEPPTLPNSSQFKVVSVHRTSTTVLPSESNSPTRMESSENTKTTDVSNVLSTSTPDPLSFSSVSIPNTQLKTQHISNFNTAVSFAIQQLTNPHTAGDNQTYCKKRC